ncbi:hypothetical protein [Streptomyces fulvorobeus]|uniref:Ornithine cyclodeaminase n=1 Tax=Streptomyces fulvorobeus TaxID=284028 RepID=A0A7Y9HHV8_9ACTN|nr:hypothetical protein [Streptomyces fulvorobeus]NYE44538.1 hypothetical protein [Streptomyces fulvorobeus]
MLHITEEQTAALIDQDLALEAARAAFAATVDGTAFPSLTVHGSDPRNRFTLKPSASATHAGVKIGTYWPGNTDYGLPRHSAKRHNRSASSAGPASVSLLPFLPSLSPWPGKATAMTRCSAARPGRTRLQSLAGRPFPGIRSSGGPPPAST